MNKVIFKGNLVRTTEIKQYGEIIPERGSRRSFAINALAVYNGKDQFGVKREAMFFDIAGFGINGEKLSKLEKGQTVLVEGRLTIEKYASTTGEVRARNKILINSIEKVTYIE